MVKRILFSGLPAKTLWLADRQGYLKRISLPVRKGSKDTLLAKICLFALYKVPNCLAAELGTFYNKTSQPLLLSLLFW